MTEGWICQRCQRSYAPTTPECKACNDAVTVRRQLGYEDWNPVWPNYATTRGTHDALPDDTEEAKT